MPNQIAWSWSRLDDFENCPRKFLHKYILKDLPRQGYIPHLEKGKYYHHGLEMMVKHGYEAALDMLPADTRDKQEWKPKVLKSMLQHKPIVDAVRNAPIFHAELSIAYDVNMSKVDWFGKTVWCRVIYDAVAIWPGQKAFVLDWKTGKHKEKITDQLKLFGGSALHEYDVPEVETDYIWLEHGKRTKSVYRQQDKEPIWQDFRERSNLIQVAQEAGNWPANPNPLCAWCDVTPDKCEYKKV